MTAPAAPPLTPAEIAELRRLHEEATPAPWEWWTSCSFRRLSHRGDGDVLHGYIQRSDGHPDVYCAEADRALIAAVRNHLGSLLLAAERAEEMAGAMEAAIDFANGEACSYEGIDLPKQARRCRETAETWAAILAAYRGSAP